MLRFFRKYMKYILAVFVALLMVAFLIEPTLSMLGPDPTTRVIGTIGSRSVTIGDQRLAHTQLRVIEQITPVLLQLSGTHPGQAPDALAWLLMLHEAQTMGLSASGAQVDQLLAMIDRDNTGATPLGRRLGVSQDTIRQTLANWVVVQSYKELVSGLVHMPVSQRVGHYAAVNRLLEMGYYQAAAIEIESAFNGAARLSGPVLERFLYDHLAKIGISVAVIPSDRYLTHVKEANAQQLTELFERYNVFLPGQSDPYGFGYRVPDRVKIEYLSLPLDRVRQKVRVEEADALSYYDQHGDEFRQIHTPDVQPAQDGPDKPLPIKPYQEVRDLIISRLRDQHAGVLADRIIKAAQAMMLEDARGLGSRGGYRTVPDLWQPVSLYDVAQRLQQTFGVLLDVRRRDDQWLSRSQLAALPGVGSSTLSMDQKQLPFVEYVFSAKELIDADNNHPLGALRLQSRLPSMPLVSANGQRHLFRLIDGETSRVPHSLDEVRPQVTRDANRLAAYRLLQKDTQKWLTEVRAEGLESWASKQGVTVHQPPPFPKRVSGIGGQLQTPHVQGIGSSQVLVDTVFDLAGRATELNPSPEPPAADSHTLDDLPASQRSGVVAMDRQMSLALVRVDRLEPMSRSNYKTSARSPQIGAWINQSLTSNPQENPLSIEAVSKRVGFEPVGPDEQGG